MKLQWYGHSCFSITLNSDLTIVTDPFDDSVGYPLCEAKADIVLTSHAHHDHNYTSSLKGDFRVLDTVGEWKFPDLTIYSVFSCHDDANGAKRGQNLIFVIEAEGMKIVHLGDLGHLPNTPEQEQALSDADLMLIPIGGYYTISTEQAVEILRSSNPRAAVAMHFANAYCHFPISDASAFIRATDAKMLPNAVEIGKNTLSGCYTMTI